MPVTALPLHLQKNLLPEADGTDHDNSFQKFWSREWSAFGPNAVEGDDGFLTLLPIPFTSKRIVFPFPLKGKWRRFPFFIFGYNVTRWISKNDDSILEVKALYGRWTFWWNLKGKVTVWQRQPTHPLYGHLTETDWQTLKATHGPSPIQEFASKGFQFSWPLIVAGHALGKPQIEYKDGDPSNPYHYEYKNQWTFRLFTRWDSYDDYTVCPAWHAGKGAN